MKLTIELFRWGAGAGGSPLDRQGKVSLLVVADNWHAEVVSDSEQRFDLQQLKGLVRRLETREKHRA